MITIIHGDDTTSSRSFLLGEKQKDKNSISLPSSFVISDLAQNIEGSSLFSETKTIVIEDFFARAKKKSREIKEITDYVNAHDQKVNLIFWEGKDLGKKDISVFPSEVIRQFKLPKALFSFLDNLIPGNFKNSIELFHKALESSAEELVIFMMERQFRLLLALLDQGSESNIDEVVRLAPWQRSRLERQAGRFSIDKLKRIYSKLYEIELAQRTGTLSLSLIKSIDFLLLEI